VGVGALSQQPVTRPGASISRPPTSGFPAPGFNNQLGTADGSSRSIARSWQPPSGSDGSRETRPAGTALASKRRILLARGTAASLLTCPFPQIHTNATMGNLIQPWHFAAISPTRTTSPPHLLHLAATPTGSIGRILNAVLLQLVPALIHGREKPFCLRQLGPEICMTRKLPIWSFHPLGAILDYMPTGRASASSRHDNGGGEEEAAGILT